MCSPGVSSFVAGARRKWRTLRGDPRMRADLRQQVIYVKTGAVGGAHDFRVSNRGGSIMQDLHYITEDQAHWLRLLENIQYEGLSDDIRIPDDVLDVLVDKGLVHRWRDGTVAITLGGIREVAQH